MNNRYAIRFGKDGYIKYTSHLDLLRMFKRAFKKTDNSLKNGKNAKNGAHICTPPKLSVI